MKDIRKAEGHGQSECRRCKELGIWSLTWTSFLYTLDGHDGYYCWEHARELQNSDENLQKTCKTFTKEDFLHFWKDSSREAILNQYYYDYMFLLKLKEDIEKAIEFIDEWSLELDHVPLQEILKEILGGNNEENN